MDGAIRLFSAIVAALAIAASPAWAQRGTGDGSRGGGGRGGATLGRPDSPPTGAAGTLVREDLPPFLIRGLSGGGSSEDFFRAVYNGDLRGAYVPVPVSGADARFDMMEQYLNTFATSCGSALPPTTRVEMTRRECSRAVEIRNRFGMLRGGECLEWVEKGTGLYADPDLWAALKGHRADAATDKLIGAASVLGQGPLSAGLRVLRDDARILSGYVQDVGRLVEINDCAGAGLKRFGENLKRYLVGDLVR